MKKRIILLALCSLTAVGLVACSKAHATEMDGQVVEAEDKMDIEAMRNKEVPEWKFSRNVARYYAEANNDLVIAEVDLSRVYTFLYDIGDFKWDKYYLPVDPENLKRIG